MPKYEVEQYELHSCKYVVKAKSRAEAIKKLWDGKGELIEGSLEYIEIPEDYYGIPVEENWILAVSLNKLTMIGHKLIGGIRSVKRITE